MPRDAASRISRLIGEVLGVLDDEERGKAGCDLAEVPAGGPHRVGREAGVERRPIVEVHRRDDDEVRLAAERLVHPLDSRRPQARRLGDERQCSVA